MATYHDDPPSEEYRVFVGDPFCYCDTPKLSDLDDSEENFEVGRFVAPWNFGFVRADLEHLMSDIQAQNDDFFNDSKTAADTWDSWKRYYEHVEDFKHEIDKLADWQLAASASAVDDRIQGYRDELLAWRKKFIAQGGKPSTPDPVPPPTPPIEIATSLVKWGVIGILGLAGIYAISKLGNG